MKFDFGNKLANYDLYTGILANCVFGFIMAVLMKWKGLYLTVSIIGIFVVIQRCAGLCQPLLDKLKIKLQNVIAMTMCFDILWSLNIMIFCIFQYDFLTFLICNMIINLFCEVGFASIGFGVNKLVAEKVDFQEYQMWQHTYSNAANLVSSGFAIILIQFVSEFSIMFIGGLLNLSYQFLAWQVRKEIIKQEIKNV